MIILLSILSAFASAIFNGSAVILEKLAVDKFNDSDLSSAHLLYQLRNNFNYILGIILDIAAWLFSLAAVHRLPLFIVQPIIACSVIVTIFIEMIILKYKPNLKLLFSLLLLIIGLVLLTGIASPEKAASISRLTELWLILVPIPLILIGYFSNKSQSKYSTFLLASVTGLSFGAIAIVGRALHFGSNYLDLFKNPLIWSIFVYSIIGMFFFTIALKKARASYVNAIVIACETIFPIIFGILFFKDHPQHNLWIVVILGFIFTIVGTILILNSIGKKILD